MSTNTTTAAKAIPTDAIDTTWSFTPTTAALSGHTFDATYSLARSGDVYVFAKVGDTPVRIHVGKDMPMYHAALEAAVAAKQPAKQADKPAEPAKPVAEAKPAAKPAKQAASKPAKAAKQPEPAAEPAKPVAEPKPAEQPAKQAAEPADKAWIGTAIEGKGWRIVFDDATQRTRVCFAAAPSAKQKEAIEAAGFYWSAQLQSWNKKLTCKAHRAALALAAALNALA